MIGRRRILGSSPSSFEPLAGSAATMRLPTHQPTGEQDMNHLLASLSLALCALVGAQGAMAQASAPTRADVKKETAAANKAGQISAGEGPAYAPPISKQTDRPRADVKKETAAANKAGQIPGTGVGESPAAAGQVSPKAAAATSTTTREDRKKATAEANKAGDIKSGEANMPAKQK
jgi:Domain of unknown function (DUF4148)